MPTSPPQFERHRWFAWRPVFLQARTGTRSLVWLQCVERRWNEGQFSGSGPLWIYRRARTGDRDDVGEAHSVLRFTKLQIGNPICKARNTSTTKEKTNTSYLVDGFAASATIVFGIDGHNKSMPARRIRKWRAGERLAFWRGKVGGRKSALRLSKASSTFLCPE